MPISKDLQPAAPWIELQTTEADWDATAPDLLGSILVQLHLVRAFEETVLDLAGQKLVNGPAHSSIGQEGGAVGSIVGLTSSDHVNGSHRGHHQFLAKAFGHVAPDGLSPTDDIPADVHDVLYRTLSEICGLRAGYCGGRGGSMHLQWLDAGALGTNAIVGGAVPFAAGSAWANRSARTEAVTVTYFGDGAVNIGSVLETMNLASAWKLPLCFFVENNRYAVATTVEEATGEPRLSGRALGFRIPSWKVDGMDPLAVHLAMNETTAHMRSSAGPTMIEADVYRYFHQNGPFPGSAFGYRDKTEEEEWRGRDPLRMVERHLLRRGLLHQEDCAALRERCQRAMTKAAARILESDPEGRAGAQRIRKELWPDPDFVDTGIRGDLSELTGSTYREASDFADFEQRKFVDVVADVLLRRMAEDQRVVVLGEDVHKLNGGPRGATKGLAEAYPERTLGTPICEAAFTGLAGGLALDGRYVPVAELMYSDFIWVAADQLFNQIGKTRHMFGGSSSMQLVLRIKIGTRTGYGSQHSMDPAGILATSPGWRVVAPSTPFDYIGLLNTAVACHDPVAVLEHDADLYRVEGLVPTNDLDFRLPVGRAAVRRDGRAVTVLTYLSMVDQTIEAAEDCGVDAEVIDLRWLDRASIDWETIGNSIRKTNRVIVAEQGPLGPSYGGWLADEIQRSFFDWLDAPVERVLGSESSPSVSKVLESAALPDVPRIAAKILEITGNRSIP